MPKFKVKSAIKYGTVPEKDDSKKEPESKTYMPGDEIELSKEEAAAMPWAVEKPPKEEVEGDDENLEAALESIRNRPDNPDNPVTRGFQSWKAQDGTPPPPEMVEAAKKEGLPPPEAAPGKTHPPGTKAAGTPATVPPGEVAKQVKN